MRINSLALHIIPWLSVSHALTFDCGDIMKDSIKWNFAKLGGKHEVSWNRRHLHYIYTTAIKIDICNPLEFDDERERKDCGAGTLVCANEKHKTEGSEDDEDIGSWPVVRNYVDDNALIEPSYTRIKTMDAAEKKEGVEEGLIAVLSGGKQDGKKQKAKIWFICKTKEEAESRRLLDSRDDASKKDDSDEDKEEWKKARETKDGAGGHIELVSYENDLLTLNWFTPHACENAANAPDKDKEPEKDKDPEKQPDSGGDDTTNPNNGGWGFFSWFFFIIFVLFAAFLAVTAWVNYTRNGARGCDLLPFSDTLRDLPYILGDWWRRIANTIGGSGTSGGYTVL